MPIIHGLDRRPWIAARKRSVQVVRIRDSFGGDLFKDCVRPFVVYQAVRDFEQLPRELPKRNLLNPKRSST
jgi:hypothetical protein